MKKKISSILLIVVLLLSIIATPATAVQPQVTAEAAIVMDARTGQVLFEKNADRRMPPASTTKMITGILAIEQGDLKNTVTISPHASQTEEAAMELKAGEQISLENLLYGALLWSSNDACVAIGEYIGGTEKNFVRMMNEKARRIGTKGTHFMNTNGLPNLEHYSTARDLAIIARYTLKNPVFAQMVSTKVKYIAGTKDQWALDNTNRLLWSYEGANGVKTGTTEEAGLCLVSSATRYGRQTIAVVLRSNDRYNDSIRLLDHGFHNYLDTRVLSKGKVYGQTRVQDGKEEEIKVTAAENTQCLVPVTKGKVEKKVYLPKKITAPVAKNQKIGHCEIYVDGQMVVNTDLVAMSNIPEAPWYLKLKRFIF